MSSPRTSTAYPPIVLEDQLQAIEQAQQGLAAHDRAVQKNLADHPRPTSLPPAIAAQPPEARLAAATRLLGEASAAVQKTARRSQQLRALEQTLDAYVTRRQQQEAADRRRRRNRLITLILLLLVGAGAALWWYRDELFGPGPFAALPATGPSTPGGFVARETELAAFLRPKVPDAAFVRIVKVQATPTPLAADAVRISFQATGRVLQPLVESVDSAAGLKAAGLADPAPASIAADLRTALSPVAQRLRELGHLGPIPANPLDTRFVRVTTPEGFTVPYAGTLHARRAADGRWTLTLENIHPTGRTPTGTPLEATAAVCRLDQAGDVLAVKKAASDLAAYARQIAQLRRQHAASLRAITDAQAGRFAALLKPGSLFLGTAALRADQPATPISFEIVQSDPDRRTLSARLRNDGSWIDARSVSGSWQLSDEGESLRLILGSRADQAIADAGPLVGDPRNLDLTLTLDESGHAASSGQPLTLVFDRIADRDATASKAALRASDDAVLSATRAGTAFYGSATAKSDHRVGHVLLRIHRRDDEKLWVDATLESSLRSEWARTVTGSVSLNRYRHQGATLQLHSDAAQRSDRASERSPMGWPGALRLSLRLDGSRLTGEDEGFTYELTPATPEILTSIERDRTQRAERYYAVVKPGAAYDGEFTRQGSARHPARLRILEVDRNTQQFTAIIESKEQKGIFHRMSGLSDPIGQFCVLSSTGGKFNPQGRLQVPLFSQDRTFFLTLTVGDGTITGSIKDDESWHATFRFDALALAPHLPGTFPTATGAYVLAHDRWVALPHNNGRVKNDLAQMAEGLGSLLGGRQGQNDAAGPDKLATLTFDGRDEIPAVSGEKVVVIFVGSLPRPSAKMLKSYPELGEYPEVELAPSRLGSDGRRHVDLLRIVPGLAGFREQRVAAMVQKPRAGVYLCVCTTPLDAGSYAFAAGENSFELKIR